MALVTELTKRLGLSVPILSAPMAGVAGGALAAAVSGVGGFGLIGGGYGDREWLSRELDIAADAGVGVGFITWALARDPDLLTVALERRPRAVLLSFGDIHPFASKVADAGVPLIAQVQTVAGAKAAVSEGAGMIVAQGTEAGGHSGGRGTMALVPAVVDAVGGIPVVAAGGIADGRGLAAALMLGASGALCGTAFYVARESLAHPNAKDAAVKASGDHTVRGKIFDIVRGHDWPEPWMIRTLENDFSRRWAFSPGQLAGDLPRQRQTYLAAQAVGDFETAAVIVGEAVDLVHQVEGAAATVLRISREAEACLVALNSDRRDSGDRRRSGQ
jgi:nitronate monooxygenase